MRQTTFTSLVALALLSACSADAGSATMYFSETDLANCEGASTPPNEPVEIGGMDHVLYPDTGLLCVSDGDGKLVRAYETKSNSEATYRWIAQTGPAIIGTKHTFEPNTSN